MSYSNTRSVFTALLLAIAVLVALPAAVFGQTFRGGISGTVTDQSGAVVPGAQITAVESATNTTSKTVSSSAGEFAFSNLPLGSYTITVTASGFKGEKVDKVPVTAGATYALPLKLAVASAGETVEVTADSLSLDTITDTQSTALPEEVVQNLPNSGRDFTQMLAQTPGFAGLSTGGGAGVGAVNGTRSNSVNWQIEGTDNKAQIKWDVGTGPFNIRCADGKPGLICYLGEAPIPRVLENVPSMLSDLLRRTNSPHQNRLCVLYRRNGELQFAQLPATRFDDALIDERDILSVNPDDSAEQI